MSILNEYTFAFVIALAVTVITTPLVRRLALKFNIVDKPNERKVHQVTMPYLGGVSIALGFFAGYIYLIPHFDARVSSSLTAFVIGGLIILVIGIIDDKYSLAPKYKLLGQTFAAILVVISGFTVHFIQFPLIGRIEFGWLAIPITIIWIVGITNAINFIDGLDGLASGVSSIALCSMLIMSILNGQLLVIGFSVILLGGTIGFLFFNIHPAKIFMGDSGSMFIGYTMAIISIMGLFKSITIFSLILPIIILGVPIFDTSFAIIRRIAKDQKISTPDKLHLHHQLLNMGFSHRTTVFIIYVISMFFGAAAVVFSRSVLWGSLFILLLSVILIRFTVEMMDSFNEKRKKPLINAIKKLVYQTSKSKG
ncbi:UDP-GlcNAc:undecaprenyl-phosphate GlcNAc-1-phosphate transferase [Pullulanibacillus pueri]|uniref:Putative undecaprenyl-phosphate N-acetylglucosaminyl 1-phosphate transferase n=1 Tax=Pullulanibacillus pueri TaxID=1437324 RepID=A0A8J3EKU7_9BACL|nr:MraY family glycosyltransferase [Pullulanibacillus pueri]MBM7683637.1 UDP-GlcNAc:undecaprenyl-phosphate GlcNAc-1-phosphate transferase [Pullulanibacillus pueri]GGH76644.1 putative undecaprenyl-phosphate N-acetylglucosaminyl 1-phosphate transferase [Pullulanibacillus pueri]